LLVRARRGALGAALHTLPERVASPRTWEEIETVCGRFANWLVLAHHVARRGETLRALDALSHARRHLLWLARLADDRTDHWLTPSRRAEIDLPAHTVAALGETTTTADPAQVDAAVRAAWRHGRRWWAQLADRHGRPVPAELFRQLDDAR
jgi:lincosamide nucleotidyltransferase